MSEAQEHGEWEDEEQQRLALLKKDQEKRLAEEEKHLQKRKDDAKKPIKKICRYYSRLGSCRFGNKCRYSHRIVVPHRQKVVYQVWLKMWTNGFEPEDHSLVAQFFDRKSAEDHLEYLHQTIEVGSWIDYYYIKKSVIGGQN